MSGEPIGTVELDDEEAQVSVRGGEISVRFSSRWDEENPCTVHLDADQAIQLAELITKAARLAPAIAEAADHRRRIVMDADAEYERAVADVIGGAP